MYIDDTYLLTCGSVHLSFLSFLNMQSYAKDVHIRPIVISLIPCWSKTSHTLTLASQNSKRSFLQCSLESCLRLGWYRQSHQERVANQFNVYSSLHGRRQNATGRRWAISVLTSNPLKPLVSFPSAQRSGETKLDHQTNEHGRWRAYTFIRLLNLVMAHSNSPTLIIYGLISQ